MHGYYWLNASNGTVARAESQLCVITVLASDACSDEVLGHRRMSASAQVGLY